ncbi:MAG: hypothetical protein G8345_15640 [Magnetococcales bacterium]|nr:hypothetical protein [Magnetococcales bacterium]
MLVVVLLGVLVSLAMPRLRMMLIEGRLEEVKPYLAAIAAKERIYKNRTGAYYTSASNDEQDLENTLGVELRDAADYCFVVRNGNNTYISNSGNVGGGDNGDAEFEVWAVLRRSGGANTDVAVQGGLGVSCRTADEKNNASGWVVTETGEPGSEGRVVALRYPPPAMGLLDTTARNGRPGVYLDWVDGMTLTDVLK